MTKKKGASVIGGCAYPPYSVKMLGDYHLLVSGGGGAAKTGVCNQIDGFLFQPKFDNNNSGNYPESEQCEKKENRFGHNCFDDMKLMHSFSKSTETRAPMNMDVIEVDRSSGRYLICSGQDGKCVVYSAQLGVDTGAADEGEANTNQDDQVSFAKLTFNLIEEKTFETDFKEKGPYQKVCRFDPCSEGRVLATGGADGHVRLWNWLSEQKILEIAVTDEKYDVDDMDFSKDASLLVTVVHGNAVFWSMPGGSRLTELDERVEELSGGHCRVRAVRFTCLGSANYVLVSAHVPAHKRQSNKHSYLALWTLNRQRRMCRSILVKAVYNQTICVLSVSDCGNFTAAGTMDGSVGVFDTHELRPLSWTARGHAIFVTGLQFVPDQLTVLLQRPQSVQKTTNNNNRVDIKNLVQVEPGPAYGYRVAVVSISSDSTIQFHPVHYGDWTRAPVSKFFAKWSIFTLILYLLLRYLFILVL